MYSKVWKDLVLVVWETSSFRLERDRHNTCQTDEPDHYSPALKAGL